MGIYTTGDRVRAITDYIAALASDIGTVTNVIGPTPLPIYCVQFDRTGDTGIMPERLLEPVTTEEQQ
jgi:hypothetical protein